MSIPNRTVSITGVFAADASTTIPSVPVSGVAYRNTAMTGTVIREGWAYKTIVDSANFNQALYEYSSVTAQVEKYGFLPWSNLTDYVQGSVCLGSNGKIYQAKQATGPSSTAYDPTTTPTVWDPVTLGVTEFLFHHIWTDYQLDRQDWLRADTFSWQPGTTYTDAYNHLVADISGISSSTETIGSYTVTYYQATDGHKICLADQETTVANIYNESGVAWYYILDTANQRFKLPRELPITDKIKGNDISIGCTDGSSNFSLASVSSYSISGQDAKYGTSVGTAASGGNAKGKMIGITKDPTKSGIISHRANENGQQYLYFYVGQFSQSATEQTAGLNSELFNGKVDLNAQNLSNAGKSLIAGLGMPSDTGIALTVLASGATQTAPANGYVFAQASASSNSYFSIFTRDSQGNNKIAMQPPTGSGNIYLVVPVKKGDLFGLSYGTLNVTTFKFFYAVGSESEAN